MKPLFVPYALLALLLISVQALSQTILPNGYSLNELLHTNRPVGIAVDSNGNLIVANVQTPPRTITRIELYNGVYISDTILITFNQNDYRPEYLTLDDDGNIYFARPDFNNGGLYRLNGALNIETIFPAGNGELDDPRGLTFDDHGNLYVANNANNLRYISRFTFDGSGQINSQSIHFIDSIPGTVMDVEVDAYGTLYIAYDEHIARAKFDSNGNLVETTLNFIQLPSSAPSNSFAAGIAINDYGDMFVSQIYINFTDSGRIFQFDTSGNLELFAIGFNQPRDIIFDADNRMYISDFMDSVVYMAACIENASAHDKGFCAEPTAVSGLATPNSDFVIYPNPTTETVDILTESIMRDATIVVFNSVGQQVVALNSITGKHITLDLSAQPPGIYTIGFTDTARAYKLKKLLLN